MKKTDGEVLEEFGRKMTAEVYDRVMHHVFSYSRDLVKNNTDKKILLFKELFSSLDNRQKAILIKFHDQQTELMISLFLGLVTDSEYKLIYETEEQRTDLDTASENYHAGVLYGEHQTENGWIARYSQYADQIPNDLPLREQKELIK